jgi:hypothetical protein
MMLEQADFEHLLQLRTGLRRFLRWNEQQSKEAGGLVKRAPDESSRSVVRVTLTPDGIAKLDALAEAHLQELTWC